MNKICTTLEQSKKLIELGIDVNTADMYYMYRHWEIDENTIGSQSDASIGFDSDFYYSANNGKTYHYIPAWSLSALLELIPAGNILLRDALSKNYKCINTVDSDLYDNPLDAVFEMVCWLKENGKI